MAIFFKEAFPVPCEALGKQFAAFALNQGAGRGHGLFVHAARAGQLLQVSQNAFRLLRNQKASDQGFVNIDDPMPVNRM